MILRKKKTAPQPPTRFFSGNLRDIDENAPTQSLMRLAGKYGQVFKMRLFHLEFFVVSSVKLVRELSDEKRFEKKVHKPLENLRAFAKDGLFTAYNHEQNWEIAHRVLMPAFSPLAVKEMLPQMKDIAGQLIKKWEDNARTGEFIDVSKDMTRLTLDTIALCSFNYRFHSFQTRELHPFVHSMVRGLEEGFKKTRRLKIADILFHTKANMQYRYDIKYMKGVADKLIEARQKNDSPAKDLLHTMLHSKDPETGEKLSYENIRHQLITFLVAGHETTSGLLSFALYHLMKNPRVLKKAYEQVDRVLGEKGDPNMERLQKLHYLEQILKETLRLTPTAPAYAVQPKEDTVMAGEYTLKKGQTIYVLLPCLHQDPDAWEKPEEFIPERFGGNAGRKISHHAWKPFGNGIRACIGRAFALQEATLALAMILQKFEFEFADPAYRLKIRETLTFKPENFAVKVKLRECRPSENTGGMLSEPLGSYLADDKMPAVCPYHDQQEKRNSLLILYGSSSGFCERFALRIAQSIEKEDSQGVKLEIMNHFKGKLEDFDKVILVISTHEGEPPHNAAEFLKCLQERTESLKGLKYAVFGCGSKDWPEQYQLVPRYIDHRLNELGAERIVETGEANVAGDFLGAFDSWYMDLRQKLMSN